MLDWFGSEVVAHLGNASDGRVSVQLMCYGGRGFAFTRREIRPMLRYKMIPDPVFEREILTRLKEITALFVRSQDAPDKQRGEHSKRWLWQRPEELTT